VSWSVELRPAARKEYRQLEDGPRRSAAFMLAELAEEGPFLTGAIPMRGYDDTWRVRFHNERFRLIYRVYESRQRISVLRIRPRASAYRGMRDGD
jgi:mRNA-degrading endonuclease RelE of RelBE toxin-antitoxin system